MKVCVAFSKPTDENTLGTDSPCIQVNFSPLSSDSYEEMPCLDCFNMRSSHRRPRFIMPSMVKKLITQRSANTPHFRIERLFDLSVYSQCWATARKHARCEPGNWGLLAKTLLSSCESKMCHSQTHWGKQFGCLRKTLWVLILSSLPWVMVPSSWLFWRNTDLGSPY